MIAYVLMLPDASVRGDAYASGEPDSSNAWTIVPLTAGPSRNPSVRVFRTPREAQEWRTRRMTYQRGRGKSYRHPVIVALREEATP